MMYDKPIVLNIKDEDVKEMIELLSNPLPGKVFVSEPVIKHLKTKKDIPTVIDYQGRRYILDDRNSRL